MVAEIIDKPLLRRRLERAHAGDVGQASFLVEHAVAELAERLAGVERRFPRGGGARRTGRRAGRGARRFGQGGCGVPAGSGRGRAARRALCRRRRGRGDAADRRRPPSTSSSRRWRCNGPTTCPARCMQVRRALRPGGLLPRRLDRRTDAGGAARGAVRGGERRSAAAPARASSRPPTRAISARCCSGRASRCRSPTATC